MEQYTDDERVEDLKKWWNDNGLSIVVGIALGVAAIFGWRYWNTYRDTQAEQASLTYDAFIEAIEKPDNDQARQRGQVLLAGFPNSPYAALTALRLAKLAVDGGDNATAIQQLQWVIDNAKLAELGDIARLRLARVWFAAGQLSDAEKLLDTVSTSSLTTELEELRGDLYLAGNDTAKARAAYAAALAAGGANRILQIKLDNLAPPTADTVIAAPAPEPAPVESAPEPVITEPTPVQESVVTEPAATEPAPAESEPVAKPAPEPMVAEPAPAPAPVESAPATEPTPESATTEAAPAEPAPAPESATTEVAPAEPAPAPESATTGVAPAEPAPATGSVSVESAPQPAVAEPVPAVSVPVEPAPAPVPIESAPATEPTPASPAPTSGPPS